MPQNYTPAAGPMSIAPANDPSTQRKRRFLENNGRFDVSGAADAAKGWLSSLMPQRSTPVRNTGIQGPMQPATTQMSRDIPSGPMSVAAGPMSRENMSVERPTPTAMPRQTFASNASAAGTTPGIPAQATPSTPQQPPSGLTGSARQLWIERNAGINSRIAEPTGGFSGLPKPTPTPLAMGGDFSLQGFKTSGGAVPTDDMGLTAATKARDDARSRFLAAMGPSTDLANLERDLADYKMATANGVASREGQGRGITADLVRGQQEKLLTQRGIEEANLISRIDITNKILNQNQTLALQELGFAKEDLDAIRTAVTTSGKDKFGEIKEFGNQLLRVAPDGTVSVLAEKAGEAEKPVALSEGQILVDPNTGAQIAINQKDRAPITLSAGQTVIDPNTGEVLYQTASKPEALPTSIQEYLFATQQGYTGSFQDFQKAATNGGGLTASAQQEVVQISSANKIINDIFALASPSGNIPGVGVFGGRVPQIFTGQNQQDVRAKLGLLRAAVVKANAGTSFTDGERALLEEYLPKPTDTDGMITTKLKNLQSYLTNKAQEIQSVAGGEPAGGSSYQGQGDDLDQLLDSVGFKNVPSMTQNGSLSSFKNAIARQESGSRYDAVGPMTARGQRAYGKYQVMDFNIPSWTQAAIGYSMTPQQFLNSPEAQEAVADHKFQEYFSKYGNWEDVASVWFSGRPVAKAGNASDVTGTTVPNYVRNIISMMG